MKTIKKLLDRIVSWRYSFLVFILLAHICFIAFILWWWALGVKYAWDLPNF